jgi:hypothetical protein
MSTSNTPEYDAVLAVIRRWSPERRLTLAQETLNSLAPSESHARPQRHTVDQASGLLATDQPPPTDADIARLLEERRIERFER